jgi:peptidoglycan hydrolase CwlO-like protein
MDELNTDRRATLGCGTLILIALIVIIFSKGGISDLENALQRANTKLDRLESSLSDQSAQLQSIRATVEQQSNQITSLKEALQR